MKGHADEDIFNPHRQQLVLINISKNEIRIENEIKVIRI